MDPQTPVEPPPPAYEAEHDFDRKISDALERSLTISNQAQQPLTIPPGEHEWEEWDEARFEAAALARAREQRKAIEEPNLPISRRSSEKGRLVKEDAWQPSHRSGEASTSSAPLAQPSRRLPVRPPTKERPSWYSETQLEPSASSGSNQNTQFSPHPLVHYLPPEEDEPNEPLPPFVAVGPSLEGPPFEEVVRQPPRRPPASNIDSPPQSPLDSVESDSLPDPPSIPELPSRSGHGECYPSTSPRQSLALSMPQTAPVPPSSPRPPPMRFDPSVAYAKHRTNLSPSETESRDPVDASALYNSAVSSHFVSSRTPRNPISLRRDTPSSSGANRPVIPVVSPTHHGPPNSYRLMQNQTSVPNPHSPYSHSLPQQSHQVVPSLYSHQFLGPTPGPSPATPPPPHWPPPTASHGGGYRR